MEGYFVSKPSNLDEVIRMTDKWREAGADQQYNCHIDSITEVCLDADEYDRFCENIFDDWWFLVEYSNQACFEGNDDGCVAHSIIVSCDGRQSIAVVMEGYDYPDCVALV